MSPEPYRSDDSGSRSSTEPQRSSSILAGMVARESFGGWAWCGNDGRETTGASSITGLCSVEARRFQRSTRTRSSTNRRRPVDELGLDCASMDNDSARSKTAIRQDDAWGESGQRKPLYGVRMTARAQRSTLDSPPSAQPVTAVRALPSS